MFLPIWRSWARLIIRSYPKQDLAKDNQDKAAELLIARLTELAVIGTVIMSYFILNRLLPDWRHLWALLFLFTAINLYRVTFKRIIRVAKYRVKKNKDSP